MFSVQQEQTSSLSDSAAASSSSSSPPRASAVPVIARSVGAPLLVSWVTCNIADKGVLGHTYIIQTGIRLGEDAPQENVYTVTRSLVDLLQFRLGFCQSNPYLYIGDLPPEDGLKHDADEVLAFVHIVVNNPSICDAVLTWHLLTTPQNELSAIGLPSTFSLFKNILTQGSVGAFFSSGPTQIPKIEELKIECFSEFMANSEELRSEIFRVLDTVTEACEVARGFIYSRIKFNQRGVHWDQLRNACVMVQEQHQLLNDASCGFENNLREIACNGSMFWPWTMDSVLADEKLRTTNQQKLETEQKEEISSSRAVLVAEEQSNNSDNNNNNSNDSNNNNINEVEEENTTTNLLESASASASASSSSSTKQHNNKSSKNALSKATSALPPHPSISLGKSFLNGANLTESTAKQTCALDLQNLTTVVTLMAKVDLACASSSQLCDENFRHSSEELKTLVALFHSIRQLASNATKNQENYLREQLMEIGKVASAVLAKVKEMQSDLRVQMQSVRSATHRAVVQEMSRWSTGQQFTWIGAQMLATEIQKRIYSELELSNSYTESLPMFNVVGGKEQETNENGNSNNQNDKSGKNETFSSSSSSTKNNNNIKSPVRFGPPILEDLSMAFNLSSLPNTNRGVRRRAINSSIAGGSSSSMSGDNSMNSGSSGGGNDAAELHRITPQPRRERQNQTVKLVQLDDPFSRL